MAEKAKESDNKSGGTAKKEYTASRTARVGSKKDGSPKISTKRGQKLSLTKEEAKEYQRYNLID